jgi:hypothetical protein
MGRDMRIAWPRRISSHLPVTVTDRVGLSVSSGPGRAVLWLNAWNQYKIWVYCSPVRSGQTEGAAQAWSGRQNVRSGRGFGLYYGPAEPTGNTGTLASGALRLIRLQFCVFDCIRLA